MIGRRTFLLAMLATCVVSLPVTPSQLESEDVKVMKCIVEVLADVLSRPHPVPVSQECLVTLKTDDRLVKILRHHNFLKELQEIAVQGGQERARLLQDAGVPDHVTPTPQTTDYAADRSMLEALGGPGERSILSQKKRTEHSDEDEEVRAKSWTHQNPGNHISGPADDWNQDKAEKRENDEEESEERRETPDDNSEENMIKDKKGAGLEEKRDARGSKTKEKKYDSEDEEEEGKRSSHAAHQQEEVKRGGTEGLRLWTKRTKGATARKEQEVPHHSKEVVEEEVKEKRSPEEKELQLIAGTPPEERRGLEEEGSASRKSEEPEIESLAAIESELENVAQKLHKMRRG